MKTTKDVQLSDDLMIPAGTELLVSSEGKVFFGDKEVDVYRLPSEAFDTETNLQHIDSQAFTEKSANEASIGDKCYDQEGNLLTIVDMLPAAYANDAGLASLSNKYSILNEHLHTGGDSAILVLSDGTNLSMADSDDIFIINEHNKPNFNDLEIGQRLQLGAEHAIVLAKQNTKLGMPSWCDANDYKQDSRLALVATESGVKIVTFED